MWRLLEKNEVPLIGDEVLQSGSLFAWVPVVNNIESSPVGCLVIRRKLVEEKLTSTNSASYAIAVVRKFAFENGHSEGGTMDQYLDRLDERAIAEKGVII